MTAFPKLTTSISISLSLSAVLVSINPQQYITNNGCHKCASVSACVVHQFMSKIVACSFCLSHHQHITLLRDMGEYFDVLLEHSEKSYSVV